MEGGEEEGEGDPDPESSFYGHPTRGKLLMIILIAELISALKIKKIKLNVSLFFRK